MDHGVEPFYWKLEELRVCFLTNTTNSSISWQHQSAADGRREQRCRLPRYLRQRGQDERRAQVAASRPVDRVTAASADSRCTPAASKPAPPRHPPPLRRLSASSIRDRMTRFVGSMTMYGFCGRCILATSGRGHGQRETGNCPPDRNVEQREIKLTRSVRSSQLFRHYNAGGNVQCDEC